MDNDTKTPNQIIRPNYQKNDNTLHGQHGPTLLRTKWEHILKININWGKMWRTLSNSFSNPHDSKTWFKLAHRALRLNGNDKTTTSNKCRLSERESHVHLLTCNKLNALRRLVLQLLLATGMELDDFSYPYTWLTCLDKNNEPLNKLQVALITIHWNFLVGVCSAQLLQDAIHGTGCCRSNMATWE